MPVSQERIYMTKSIISAALILIGCITYRASSNPEIANKMMRYFVQDLPSIIVMITVIIMWIRYLKNRL